MDLTGLGILVGVCVALPHAVLRMKKTSDFDPMGAGTLFLGAAGIPLGFGCILAAWSGNPQDLPSLWREYIAAAGVIAVGLTINKVISEYRSLFASPGISSPTPVPVASANEAESTPAES